MNIYKTLTFLILLFPFTSFAQQDSTVSGKIITKFEHYSASHPTEKAYLHFDRPYYAAGDTVYFKAYVTLGETHQLSALSGVLHIELIDNLAGKALREEKLEITNGVAWGDFALPDTLYNGSYGIRAYTQLMRNTDGNTFFEQDIPIVAVRDKKAATAAITTKTVSATATATVASSKPDIQFFPEGGSLIDGLPNRIAFKAIAPGGIGIAVKGIVTDNTNAQVCTFASAHLGMGSVVLTPQAGKTYKAQITYANGVTDEISLPQAKESGIALSVINDSTLVASININANQQYLAANKGKIFTLAVYTGGIMTAIPCRLDSTTLTVLLYKRKLHTGITRLTLFAPGGEPLCERLMFVNNNDELKLTVSTDKAVYTKREKVTVKLNAQTLKGLPANDLSVAVISERKVPIDSNNESNILNYLLLTSELKGNIEQPNYYFNHTTPEAFANLDVLMMTQGYRSFEWKQVLNNNDTVPKYQPEKLLSINGTVKTLQDKPVPNAEVGLGSIKLLLARDTTADANGNFEFDDLYITDTAKLLLKSGKGNKSWKATIGPDNEPAITPVALTDTANTLANNTLNPGIAAQMKKDYQQSGDMHSNIMLKEISIHENKNPEHLVPLLHSDNLNGPGMADQVIMGDDLGTCPTLIECLVGRLRGARFSGPTPTIYSLRTTIALSGPTKPMALLLNGIIQSQDNLDNINPSDVYSIEVLEDPQYLTVYGSQATGGLLVITTRNGTEKGSVSVQPGLTIYTFEGFYKARQFYSPKYGAKTPAINVPDTRRTIYWKPVLLTDKDGNASFDFYTSDDTGTCRIVIEGIDANGNLGEIVLRYNVNDR